ncbi:MAG TPA: cytochrome c oxidase subunit 3 [Mycobacterium sp.]|nr:cytochrome c oxidase subunit 3 [Mycobacterium sp.]
MAVETETPHAHTSGVDKVPSVVLGVVFFVCSEAIFFSALYTAWYTASGRSTHWPPIGIDIHPTLGAVASGLLILSSVQIFQARLVIRRGDTRGMSRLLWGGIVLGLCALGVQLIDLSQLNFTVSSNGFGTIYWTISVLDSAHVAGAIIFAFLVLDRKWLGAIGRNNHDLMTAAAIFWHFVVGLSVFTFFVLEVLS